MDINEVLPDLTDWTLTIWSAYDAVKAWANEEVAEPEIAVETTKIAIAVSTNAVAPLSGVLSFVVGLLVLYGFLWLVHSHYNVHKASGFSSRFGSWIARFLDHVGISHESPFWQDMFVLYLAAQIHAGLCVWGCYRLVKFYHNAVPDSTLTTPKDTTNDTTPHYNLRKYVIPREPDSKHVDIALS